MPDKKELISRYRLIYDKDSDRFYTPDEIRYQFEQRIADGDINPFLDDYDYVKREWCIKLEVAEEYEKEMKGRNG